jgi:sulfate adenylyltransferase subunit 1 (EFTu-like GTPase family)
MNSKLPNHSTTDWYELQGQLIMALLELVAIESKSSGVDFRLFLLEVSWAVDHCRLPIYNRGLVQSGKCEVSYEGRWVPG